MLKLLLKGGGVRRSVGVQSEQVKYELKRLLSTSDVS